jgi:hypothetical protein
MPLKPSKRKVKSGSAHRSDERDAHEEIELKRLSSALEEYGDAAEEGAVEKISELAKEIVEIIARSRRQISSSGYYRRRIE